MPATARIDTAAREDRKVAPRIKRVAETNLLGTLSQLDLSGKEFRLMAFLIEQHGTYAGNQWMLMRRLKMSRRTLSWAQRRLAQRGLLDLKYTGKLTRYTIRLKGVEMALKSASSKGCATGCASIESSGKDRKDDSGGSDIPSALPTRRPTPPEFPQAEVPALPTGERNPRAGTHPDFACARGPDGRETYAMLGDRLAGAWGRVTGYRWTRVDHKNARDHIAPLDDPEGFLEFALTRWADIVAAEFHYRTESPAPAAPVLNFLIRHREAFLSAWGAKAELGRRAEEGRVTRAWLLDWESIEALLGGRADRAVVEKLLEHLVEYGPDEVVAAIEVADRMAAACEGLPYAAQALAMFLGAWWDEGDDPEACLRCTFPLADYMAEDESNRGEHPCPVLAWEIWSSGGDTRAGLATWLARRLHEEYRKAGRSPNWNAACAALADDGASDITGAVDLALTKGYSKARYDESNAAQEAGTLDALYDDRMRTIWDRYEAELREQYHGR